MSSGMQSWDIPGREEMIRALVPPPTPEPLLRPRWANVVQLNPLRVQMVGDPSPVEVTPESLISGLTLGDRVWTGLTDRGSLIVIGRSGGDRPIELGPDVDLNTIIDTGVYTQSQSAEASVALDYPEALAGLLEVYSNPAGTMVWQRYTPYGSYGKVLYTRTRYNTTWFPWQKYTPEPDIVYDTGSFTPATGWTVQYSDIRQFGRFVHYAVRAQRTAGGITIPADGNITNTPILTITKTDARPVTLTALSTSSAGPVIAGYVSSSDGTVSITAVGNSSVSLASGVELSMTGVWFTAS